MINIGAVESFFLLLLLLKMSKVHVVFRSCCLSDINMCLPVPGETAQFPLVGSDYILSPNKPHHSSPEEDWGHVYTKQDQRVLL